MSQSKVKTPGYKYVLALAALGVVYGDIGTSPLYALKEAFHHGNHMLANPQNVMGLISLIFWSLMLVISVKYLGFILRADDKGEGGILALTSLITPSNSEDETDQYPKKRKFLILLGLFGTALLYGDGMITPAISILSAVEGLSLITPMFSPYVTWITVGILIGLFSIQKHGTNSIGKIFGPVTLTWFIVIAILGVNSIFKTPEILKAINPVFAISFFQNNMWYGFVALGSVFLVVTGGEALYSDLGHFGRKPITQAWFFVALPALTLNYFGQGALLLRTPAAIDNPFFLLAPSWALYPLVILAALATTIASQALITGVFSITMQAVQHKYSPRLHIAHTSEKESGQIYVKNMSRFLMVGAIGLVFAFKSSSNLAAAYGLAVTTTMVITTILFYVVAREKWGWSRLVAGSLCGFFLIIDLGFWGANILKIVEGGWFPLLVGIVGFTLMTTWHAGRKLMALKLAGKVISLDRFLKEVDAENPTRIDGTAVYFNRSLTLAPYALVHTYEHFKTVHRNLIFLSVVVSKLPIVQDSERSKVENLGGRKFYLTLNYGYLELPDIPRDIKDLKFGDIEVDYNKISYVIGRQSVYATDLPGMAIWREKIFSLIAKNEISATDYFQLPKDRVVEIGIQIEI
ncbi:MAG: potassium transporter Kup [Bdellovibrio sp.]|nr:potassium transporter Kup [Bdellovibrio sp.]